MKYTQSQKYAPELRQISDVLELINYRKRTIESYLQAIFECCTWLEDTYHTSIDTATVPQLRAFLLYLKRDKKDGGRNYAPRSVNLYNCAIKKYSRFVLRKPLTNDDLPLCRIDIQLPKVPSKQEIRRLISDTKNLKHQAVLAIAYGAALRITETATLRWGDISFSRNTITIREEVSKNRYAGMVELPQHLKHIIYRYLTECCPEAGPSDWVFPGQHKGTHISKNSLAQVLKKRLRELRWEDRGYTFHSLRHAHALHYYQAGADLFQVQQRLRHRSISSTLIYVRLDAKLKERPHVDNPFDTLFSS